MLDKLSRFINRQVEYLLFIFGLGMTLIVVAQVFARYVLNSSLFWSEELARYLLVWLTFLGASTAYRHGLHPGVDVFYTRMPRTLKKAAAILVHVLSLFLFGTMVVKGIAFACFVRLQISPALSLPKWIIMAVVPVSGIVFFIHGLHFLLREIRKNEDVAGGAGG